MINQEHAGSTSWTPDGHTGVGQNDWVSSIQGMAHCGSGHSGRLHASQTLQRILRPKTREGSSPELAASLPSDTGVVI